MGRIAVGGERMRKSVTILKWAINATLLEEEYWQPLLIREEI